MNGALVGALVGAYSGVSLLPKDMKEHLQNGVRIEGLATAMAETLWSAGV